MSLHHYISFKYFFASFLLGLLFTSILDSDKKKILLYPTPKIFQQYFFRDQTKKCFTFYQNEIQCPFDKSKINQIPVQ